MSSRAGSNLLLPEGQRIASFLQEVDNPYEIQSGSIKVRMSFSGTRQIEDVVSHYLAMRENADSAMQIN